ncbi:MAG TPA: DUF2784 domain-containing protein [Casimicrobiaceae bacterium]|nr:DUF2784 domain-containing protein [Casimicrobiaceae bacterium]
MMIRLAADAVLVAHLAFILFASFGALLALRWRWIPFVQIPAAAWGFFVEATGRICPLTYVENALRVRAGASGYGEGFIEHYLLPIIYPAGLTHGIQVALAVVVVALNVAIYAVVLRRSRGGCPLMRRRTACERS